MKTPDLITTAIRDTFRSKARTILTIVAIAIGAFTLTLTTAIGSGVSSYISTQVSAIGVQNALTVTKTSPAANASDGPRKYQPGSAAQDPSSLLSVALTQKDLDTIRNTSGVQAVTPALRLAPDYIEFGDHGKYVLSVNAASAITKASLAAGKQLDQKSSSDELLLPKSYVKSLGFGSQAAAVGATVTIGITDYTGHQQTVDATIAGVQNDTLTGGGAALNDALATALESAQNTGKPAAVPTTYSSATVTFAANSSDAKVDQLKQRLSDEGYTGKTVQDELGSFETVINGITGILDAFAVIALIAAGFGIVNTLLMSVQERTREIGLMKAMGMGSGRVFALFSIEAAFIGFLGSAVGAIIAIGLGIGANSLLANTVLSALPGLNIVMFTPAAVATIIVIVMLIAFLAGTLPARRAARQNPIDALRYE